MRVNPGLARRNPTAATRFSIVTLSRRTNLRSASTFAQMSPADGKTPLRRHLPRSKGPYPARLVRPNDFHKARKSSPRSFCSGLSYFSRIFHHAKITGSRRQCRLAHRQRACESGHRYSRLRACLRRPRAPVARVLAGSQFLPTRSCCMPVGIYRLPRWRTGSLALPSRLRCFVLPFSTGDLWRALCGSGFASRPSGSLPILHELCRTEQQSRFLETEPLGLYSCGAELSHLGIPRFGLRILVGSPDNRNAV